MCVSVYGCVYDTYTTWNRDFVIPLWFKPVVEKKEGRKEGCPPEEKRDIHCHNHRHRHRHALSSIIIVVRITLRRKKTIPPDSCTQRKYKKKKHQTQKTLSEYRRQNTLQCISQRVFGPLSPMLIEAWRQLNRGVRSSWCRRLIPMAPLAISTRFPRALRGLVISPSSPSSMPAVFFVAVVSLRGSLPWRFPGGFLLRL